MVVLRIVVVGIILRDTGRRLWCAGPRYVDDESFVNRLAAGVVCVEGPAHLFLGAQDAFLALSIVVARQDAQREIGSVEASTKRIAILSEDHLAHIVDEVILADLDQRGRGALALDPDLAVQHAGVEVGGASEVVVGSRRAGRGGSGHGRVCCEQRLDGARIRGCDEGLAADRRRAGARREGGELRGVIFGARKVCCDCSSGGQRWRLRLQGRGWQDGGGLLEGDCGTAGGVGERRGGSVGGLDVCVGVGVEVEVAGALMRMPIATIRRQARCFGPTGTGPHHHLRLHHAAIVALGGHVGGGYGGQLGQRDALAQAARRVDALAACRRTLRCRRRDVALPAEEFGPRVADARPDAAHDGQQPASAGLGESSRGRTRTVLRRRRPGGGRATRGACPREESGAEQKQQEKAR